MAHPRREQRDELRVGEAHDRAGDDLGRGGHQNIAEVELRHVEPLEERVDDIRGGESGTVLWRS